MLTTVVAVVFMASSALAEVVDVIDNHGGRVDQYDARWRGVAARDGRKRNNDPYKPSGIDLRPCDARGSREDGGTRCQMQKLTAWKFHGALLLTR